MPVDRDPGPLADEAFNRPTRLPQPHRAGALVATRRWIGRRDRIAVAIDPADARVRIVGARPLVPVAILEPASCSERVLVEAARELAIGVEAEIEATVPVRLALAEEMLLPARVGAPGPELDRERPMGQVDLWPSHVARPFEFRGRGTALEAVRVIADLGVGPVGSASGHVRGAAAACVLERPEH